MGKLAKYLEKKCHGKGIPNLPLIMIGCYIIGYIFEYALTNAFNGLGISAVLSLNPYAILHGQVWRLVTWLLIPPPSSNIIYVVIMLLFYYSISRQLVQAWGDFYFTYYIFSGIVFTIIGSFVTFGLCELIKPIHNFIAMTDLFYSSMFRGAAGGSFFYYMASLAFTTYYINMSIFLAFAATFPNNVVMLYFLIPIKVKWLGVVYAVMMGYEVVDAVISDNSLPYWWLVLLMVILSSLLNFLVFYLSNLNIRGKVKQAQRRREYAKKVEPMQYSYASTRHKCAICGRNSVEHPYLQFRFCSKCVGSYEYCNDHLFTHTHITEYGANQNHPIGGMYFNNDDEE
ncbi:MAG: hypothetical protein MJ105_07635 [Lachnospiraceae bacterium]|nr:hypothetical protein [Lachnospiraceae bacterium]